MRIRARQHIPAFVDGGPPETADVASVDALLAVPWIACWTDPLEPGIPFARWSVSDRRYLMAEYGDGVPFYVVATLESDAPIPLPVWTPPPATVH